MNLKSLTAGAALLAAALIPTLGHASMITNDPLGPDCRVRAVPGARETPCGSDGGASSAPMRANAPGFPPDMLIASPKKLVCLQRDNDNKDMFKTCQIEHDQILGTMWWLTHARPGLSYFAPWAEAYCQRGVVTITCKYEGVSIEVSE